MDWYLLEWEPFYGPAGPGDAKADLESRCNREGIPAGLVAMEADQVVGVVALDLDTATNLTPSVVGLLVRHDQRGRGIATSLLQAAESLAKRFGFSRLYVSTTVLGELLLRTGWHRYGVAEFLNDESGSVYARDL